jgi:hypothetical protein
MVLINQELLLTKTQSVYGNLSSSRDFRFGSAGNSEGGLYGGGSFAYATNHKSSSLVLSGSAVGEAIVTNVTANLLAEINFDTDLSASIATAGITAVTKVAIPVTGSLTNPRCRMVLELLKSFQDQVLLLFSIFHYSLNFQVVLLLQKLTFLS